MLPLSLTNTASPAQVKGAGSVGVVKLDGRGSDELKLAGDILPGAETHQGMYRRLLSGLIGLLVLLGGELGAAPRVLPVGELPADTRLGPLRGEQADFPLVPAASPEEWQARSERIRQIMLVSLGLWPMPEKTPLNAVIHGTIDGGEYTVEKVYFESLPGFFVTGNIYRPKGRSGKLPGVLCPHGHFPGGRFQDSGPDGVRREIAAGAERFEEGGRSVMQSRCVQLARMGSVVFHYDKIGYGDSQQLSEELVHRFSRTRVKYREPPPSGFYSAEAESRLQNVMGLHTWNSIRALDFLIGLPEVDESRIAITGASGGGTQTFMLCAVDSRPLVSVPVVIVSTTRQGGCTCENICGLRIGANNIEFTALHAPKPLLLISADDATKTMRKRGFPELKQHYRTLGAESNAAHAALLHFPHNYNYVSRTAMYHFVNKHLRLGLSQPILEHDYRRLSREELSVWDDKHPAPPGGVEIERKVLDWLTRDADRLMTDQKVVATAWDILLRRLPADHGVKFVQKATTQRSEHRETLGLVEYRTSDNYQARLPCIRLEPGSRATRTVIWVHPQGKAGMYNADGSLTEPVRMLLAGGARVISADLLYQGEFLGERDPPTRQRWLENEEGFAGWTYCYNRPLLAQRAEDIQALIALARGENAGPVDVAGFGPAAVWAAAAIAQSGGAVRRAALDTGGFRFAEVKDVYDVNFLPGAVKYGDVAGLFSLAGTTSIEKPPAK